MRSVVCLFVLFVMAWSATARAETVFSLDDNRLLAHVLRDGDLVIPAGHPGFAKYTRFARERGWKLGQTVDGRRVALLEKGAALTVPVVAPATKLSLRLHSEGKQRLSVTAGAATTHHDVAAGWQTIEVTVALAAGEQKLAFKATRRLAIAELRIGRGRVADEPTSAYDAEGFTTPADGGIAMHLFVPDGARLAARATCDVRVTAGGDAVTLGPRAVEVPLPRAAGKVVRLELRGTKAGCHVRDARLVVPGNAPAPPAREGRPRPRYVVFWIMDSLRADRLRAFVPGARPDTPNFDALARTSTLFTGAYIEGNESRVSHGSLWSALLPVLHRMYRAGQKLDRAFVTLAEAMKAGGYATAGVTANGWIAAKHGFGDGWDLYHNHIHEQRGLRGADVLDAALAAVEKKQDAPWFLYVGTIDTHVSWRAKEPWMSKYDPEPYTGKFKSIATGVDIDRLGRTASKVPPRDRQRIVALYDSNVSYQDMLLGKLLARLDAWGIRDQTMIVITADHGDELFEDGRVGHGASLRETLVHVPLLVSFPPLFPAGKVTAGVHGIDVLPTLVDAIGGAPITGAQGESLIPLAWGVGARYPRPAFASQYERAHVMRLGSWKVRVGGDGVAVLYDLAADPDERADVSASHPVEYRFVADALGIFLAYQDRWQKTRWGVASNASPSLAPDLEK